MKTLRKTILGGMLAFCWMLAWGSGAATAAPVKAKALVVYVDDILDNNGSVKCPSTNYHTLADAVVATGMRRALFTIYLCPGTYVTPGNGLEFRGVADFKFIGKGSPIIIPPNGLPGSLISVVNSDNVTIQGLAIDGGGGMDTTNGAAISFEDTSGTITGNTISGWHRPMPSNGPIPFDAGTRPMHSILVNGNGATMKKVQISNNTIYDSQDTGILVVNYSSISTPVKIVKNRIVFGSAIIPAYTPAATVRLQAGIALVNSGPGALISGNQVISNADLYPMPLTNTRGIMIYGTSGTKVIGNTVRGTATQISIENWCNIVGITANNNIISGNRLYDTWNTGVLILVTNTQVSPAFNCNIEPYVDHNQIKGNTIYALDFNAIDNTNGQYGVSLVTVGGTILNTQISGNTIAGFGPARSITINHPNDVLGTVQSGNKLLDVPPAGVYK